MEDSITDILSPRQMARMLLDDIRELESMSPADKAHYCATPGGSRCNSMSRGR
jgi:hypothetical protein